MNENKCWQVQIIWNDFLAHALLHLGAFWSLLAHFPIFFQLQHARHSWLVQIGGSDYSIVHILKSYTFKSEFCTVVRCLVKVFKRQCWTFLAALAALPYPLWVSDGHFRIWTQWATSETWDPGVLNPALMSLWGSTEFVWTKSQAGFRRREAVLKEWGLSLKQKSWRHNSTHSHFCRDRENHNVVALRNFLHFGKLVEVIKLIEQHSPLCLHHHHDHDHHHHASPLLSAYLIADFPAVFLSYL